MTEFPRLVSIIVPCRNEEKTIGLLLTAILQQSIPPDQYEVIVADGESTDHTREVIQGFRDMHPEIHLMLVENPDISIPAALNRALHVAQGRYIIRLDAHSVPARDYVERCVATLEATRAANVGGVWEIQPGSRSRIARSIALAVAHPLGAGDARYRTGGVAGEVDTVPFGAFSREWMEKVGFFNESLLTNEDYEYNTRLRQAGGVIWFDPSIRSTYFSRSSLFQLLGQYYRYGYWKARMLRIFPKSLRWRQAIPPFFVLVTFALMLGSIFSPIFRLLLGVQWGTYTAILLFTAISIGIQRRDFTLVFGFFMAIPVMHLAWGMGFLVSLAELIFGLKPDNE